MMPGRDRTFVDPARISHEAVDTYHRTSIVSLCGQLHDPTKIVYKTIDTLQAYATSDAPVGVDCMTCLVNRARLDAMIARDVATDPVVPMVQIELRIVSWE